MAQSRRTSGLRYCFQSHVPRSQSLCETARESAWINDNLIIIINHSTTFLESGDPGLHIALQSARLRFTIDCKF